MAKKERPSDLKTNVCRLFEQAGVPYDFHYCPEAEGKSGLEIAAIMGQDPDRTFKTLVTVGKSGEHFVFIIPVAGELDLKKAAEAVGEKAIAMIKSKELLPLTGYIHGGCSPIGMKKFFRTVLDETAVLFDTICFSAGRVGMQVEIALSDLEKMIPYSMYDLTKEL